MLYSGMHLEKGLEPPALVSGIAFGLVVVIFPPVDKAGNGVQLGRLERLQMLCPLAQLIGCSWMQSGHDISADPTESDAHKTMRTTAR